jgi:hypothetical protein
MKKATILSFALLLGLLTILPYWYAYLFMAPVSGERINFFYQDSELVYLSRIREIVEGNITAASPFFYEYKNVENIQQPFGEWFYALLSFGSTELIPFVAMASKFLFPAILSLLIYGISLRLYQGFNQSGYRFSLYALAITTLVILGYDLTNAGFWSSIFSGSFSHPWLSIWSRIVHPITGAIGLFGVVYLTVTLGEKNTHYRVIGAGLLLGTMSGYVFSFVIASIFLLVLFIWSLAQRYWNGVYRYLGIFAIAAIVNLWYAISLFTTYSDASDLGKNGMIFSHDFLHNKVLYVTIAVFLLTTLFVFRQKSFVSKPWNNHSWQIMVALLIASFVSLNIQIVFGKTVWPGHYVQYINPICYIIVCVCISVVFDAWIARNSQLRLYRDRIAFASTLFIITTLIILSFRVLPSVYSLDDTYADAHRYVPILQWLSHKEGPCVVFVAESEERLEKYIPAYTQCDLYHTAYVFHAVPYERILHNYILELRLLGISESALPQYLSEHPERIRRYFFEDWVDMFYNPNDTWVFNSKTEAEREAFIPKYSTEIIAEYKRTVDIPLNDLLNQYKIDYLIFDQRYTELPREVEEYPTRYEHDSLRVLAVPGSGQ